MNLSAQGRAALIKREGLRLSSYKDSAGIWTIGVGHTPSYSGQTITRAEADDLFDSDVLWAVECVNKTVRRHLNQDQFDCLVSFTFNVGQSAFRSSTLVKELNKGHYALAANQLNRWNKITLNGQKVVSGGLVYRRASEAAQWYSILNTNERECPIVPVRPSGRTVTDLAKGSKTAQAGAAVTGISLIQMEELTASVGSMSDTWASIAPTLIPYMSYIGVAVGIFIFARRWYDSRRGTNY